MSTHFSAWVHWDNRRSLPQRDGPGVYVLGQFEAAPPRITDPIDERVILIAETHKQTLARRWQQFHAGATRGQEGHAGGVTFWRLYANPRDDSVPGWLFVAACDAPAGASDVQGYIQSLKDELLSQYQERHGVLPVCNRRGPAGMTDTRVPRPQAATAASMGQIEPEQEVELPPLEFSPWTLWTKRIGLAGIDAAGVYALAQFDNDGPPDAVDLQDERIVYIGETCDNSIRGRLSQFQRSAFAGKDGHSGGWTYRKRIGSDEAGLFVAILPIAQLVEPHRSAYIRFVERDLLWHYVRRWGRRPLCNSK